MFTTIHIIHRLGLHRLAERMADHWFPLAPWEADHDLADPEWAEPRTLWLSTEDYPEEWLYAEHWLEDDSDGWEDVCPTCRGYACDGRDFPCPDRGEVV